MAPKMTGRHRGGAYEDAWSWSAPVDSFVREVVTERPLLNVCSGATDFGDTAMDKYHPGADVRGDWLNLPFAADSFGAVFSDPPWNSGYKRDTALFVQEALRVAPVVYVMAPFLYVSRKARITQTWVRHLPGIHNPVLFVRYERPAGATPAADSYYWQDKERKRNRRAQEALFS